MTRRQRLLVIGLLAAVYFVYVACFLGLLGSNDGSHFALTQAIAERGTYRIGNGRRYALSDVAVPKGAIEGDGRLYSNKPPGTALLGVPFYWLGLWTDPLLSRSPPPDQQFVDGQPAGTYVRADRMRMKTVLYPEATKYGYEGSLSEFMGAYRRDWPRQNSVNLAPALAGVACTALVFLLARQLGAGFTPSVMAMLLAAVGTLQWRYSTALFAHVFSAAILLGQVYLLVSGTAWSSTAKAAAWGALVTFAGLVEYQALATVPLAGLYWLWRAAKALDRDVLLRRLGAVMLGGAVPLAYLGLYQWQCFGDPLQTTVTRSIHFEYAENPSEMLRGSPRLALSSMMFGFPHAPEHLKEYRGEGLLTTSPFLVLAVPGWFFCRKGARTAVVLVASVVVLHVGLISFVRAPMGGATYDVRYLMRVVPLVATGFAIPLAAIGRVPWWPARLPLYAPLALLGSASVWHAARMMGTFQRHDIFLPGLVGDLTMGRLVLAGFSNLGNWPLFVVAAAVGAVLVIGWAAGRWVWRARSDVGAVDRGPAGATRAVQLGRQQEEL